MRTQPVLSKDFLVVIYIYKIIVIIVIHFHLIKILLLFIIYTFPILIDVPPADTLITKIKQKKRERADIQDRRTLCPEYDN